MRFSRGDARDLRPSPYQSNLGNHFYGFRLPLVTEPSNVHFLDFNHSHQNSCKPDPPCYVGPRGRVCRRPPGCVIIVTRATNSVTPQHNHQQSCLYLKFGGSMSLASAQAPARPAAFFDDEALIRECLQGSEEAWGNLIDKYKNLIFSIPVKVGLSQDDASEVFQMVCAELVKQLPNLRKPRALPQWLIKVATHESFRTVSRNRRFVEVDSDVEDNAGLNTGKRADEIVRQAEQEQLLRNAISTLQPR